MKPLDPGDEVMLHGAAAASAVSFNPYYGLVVKDHGWNVSADDRDEWDVTVLWEDGCQRVHRRQDLLDWKSLPKAS